MHDHNNNNTNVGGRGMIWMMVPCLLLLGVLFLGGGKLSGGGYLWPILIGVFVVAHVWMMFRGYGKHVDTDMEEKTDDAPAKDGTTDKHGSCCH